MYYRCQHCDQPFESAEERPRCPRCLRMTTVVAIGMPGQPASGHPAAPRPYRRARTPGKGVPWTLSLGAAMLGASAVAVLLTDFQDVSPDEQLGMAIGFAAVGGAGLALALWGLRHYVKRR